MILFSAKSNEMEGRGDPSRGKLNEMEGGGTLPQGFPEISFQLKMWNWNGGGGGTPNTAFHNSCAPQLIEMEGGETPPFRREYDTIVPEWSQGVLEKNPGTFMLKRCFLLSKPFCTATTWARPWSWAPGPGQLQGSVTIKAEYTHIELSWNI